MDLVMLTVGESLDKVFYGFDIAVFKFFAAMQCTFLTFVAKFFTAFGDENFIIPVMIIGLVLLMFKKTRKYGVALVGAIIIGTLMLSQSLQCLESGRITLFRILIFIGRPI